jgi:hypothetical protein
MRLARAYSLLVALALAVPATGAIVAVPEGGFSAAGVGSAASAVGLQAVSPHLGDPGPSLMVLDLAAKVAFPQAPDALAPMRAGPYLEIGAGPHALLAQHMIRDMGFAPEKVHAVDPRLANEAHPVVPVGNFRRVGAENLPAEWDGRFDSVATFFTFNPEIVSGSTHGMGHGIEVRKAAARIAAVMRSGARLLVVTGATGIDEDADAAFREHLQPAGKFSAGIDVYRKP